MAASPALVILSQTTTVSTSDYLPTTLLLFCLLLTTAGPFGSKAETGMLSAAS